MIHGLTKCSVFIIFIIYKLNEVFAVASRIAVMHRGQIVAVVETKKTTREQLGLWMDGAHVETA